MEFKDIKKDEASRAIADFEALPETGPTPSQDEGQEARPAEIYFDTRTGQGRLFVNPKDPNADSQVFRELAFGTAAIMAKATPKMALELAKNKGVITDEMRARYNLDIDTIPGELVDLPEDEIAEQLLIFKDGLMIQTILMLSDWVYNHKTTYFYWIPLDVIIKDYYGKKKGYKLRREISNRIMSLARYKLPIKDKVVNNEGKEVEFRGYFSIFDGGGEWHRVKGKKGGIIKKLYGWLAPGINIFRKRGEPFAGLAKLENRTEGPVIVLGYLIQYTLARYWQNPILITRGTLIKWADLEASNKANPSQVSKRLMKYLERLKEVGAIKDYTPKAISTDNKQEIIITGPFRANRKPLNPNQRANRMISTE